MTGADGITLTGADGITLTGADGSTYTGPNGITLTGADGITLTGADGITLTGADAKDARILWEAEGSEPTFGPEFNLPSAQPSWAEVEALLPDGRLGFSATNFTTARGAQRTAQRK